MNPWIVSLLTLILAYELASLQKLQVCRGKTLARFYKGWDYVSVGARLFLTEISLSRWADSKWLLSGQATMATTGLLWLLAGVNDPRKSNYNRQGVRTGVFFPAAKFAARVGFREPLLAKPMYQRPWKETDPLFPSAPWYSCRNGPCWGH